jgi:hypothetical protein
MSDQHELPTLTDDEIQTRRVDGDKLIWEAPRLAQLSVGGSRKIPAAVETSLGDDGSDFDQQGPGPS